MFFSSTHIGIGTVYPDENSILDIYSTDKGVLIPRVVLDNANTDAFLIVPITNGMLIYSEGGLELDGFYYLGNNNWNPLSEKLKKVIFTLLDGDTSRPHTIPSNVDKFETYDGDWPNLLTLPYASDSNLANRFNKVIIIEKKSTFHIVILSTNIDMSYNLVHSRFILKLLILNCLNLKPTILVVYPQVRVIMM